MTNLISSVGSGDSQAEESADDASPKQSRRDRHRDKRSQKIPTLQECLRALQQIAGLVIMGLMKPAQANAIRASYVEILRYHQRHESRDQQAGISDDRMLDILRKDPKLLAIIEPLLTDDQVDMVMQSATGSDDGQA